MNETTSSLRTETVGFFVRHSSGVPALKPRRWNVRVTGDVRVTGLRALKST